MSEQQSSLQEVSDQLAERVMKWFKVKPHLYTHALDSRVLYWSGEAHDYIGMAIGFHPAQRDEDTLLVVDRLLHDYSGTALHLTGPSADGSWLAAIGSNAGSERLEFVVAETRPLSICLAVLRFLDKYGDTSCHPKG